MNTNKRTRILGMSLAVAGALAASADTHTLKAGLRGPVDLTSPDSYEEGAAPVAGDSITMQNWVSGKGYTYVTNSIAADAKSWELLRSLSEVYVNYGDTFALVVDGASECYDLPCKVNGMGVFVKLGDRRLNLLSHDKVSGSNYTDYEVGLAVEAGTLALPNIDGTTGSSAVQLKTVRVAEGATLVTAGGTPSSGTIGIMTTLTGFSGAGTITNETQGGSVLYDCRISLSNNEVFSGRSGGPIRLRVQSGWTLSLVGANLRHSKNTEAGFGATIASDDLEHLGTGALTFGSNGGTYRYVGEVAHECDKQITATVSPAVLDGGAFGGLTFSGYISAYSSTASQNIFCLSGDGDEPNHFTGRVYQQAPTAVGKTVPYYMIKRGKGTWTFNGSQKAPSGSIYYNLCGTLAVEAGTLEFGSIAPRGVNCALGYATACYERKAGAVSDLQSVDYAYLLGATNAAQRTAEGEARFVYTGSANAAVTDRPIAVQNDAALGVTQAAELSWTDVRNEGTGPRTLALETAAGSTIALADIVDSDAAPLSIEKRGAGTSRIGGRQALHGGASVAGGRLVVENASEQTPYRWFRFIIKETAATCSRYPACNSDEQGTAVGEIALYDVNGNRQSLNLADASGEDGLEPGLCRFGASNMIYSVYKACAASCYFDQTKPDKGGNYGDICRVVLNKQVKLDDESTWWPAAVFRLTNGAPEIVSWDFVATATNGVPKTSDQLASMGRQVTAARLQGSRDGVHWITLDDRDEIAIPTKGVYYWASTDSSWTAGNSQVRKLSDGKGWGLTRRAVASEADSWKTLSHVSVASGGSLTFEGDRPTTSRLIVDATGGGSLSNVAFAATGTLEVENLGKGAVKIPFDFSGTTGSANIGNWKLVSNGQDLTGKRDFAVDANGITVFAKGMVLIVR